MEFAALKKVNFEIKVCKRFWGDFGTYGPSINKLDVFFIKC